MSKALAVVIIALMSMVTAMLADAEARIQCNGAYQVQRSGAEIATPYCEDAYIAQVARGYGMRVSARSIRRNPNRKEEVCLAIGHDSRIYEYCQKYQRDSCSGRRC